MFLRILVCVVLIQIIETSPAGKEAIKAVVKIEDVGKGKPQVLVRRQDADPCLEHLKVGPCKAHIPRYFFNETSKTCRRFAWGGCDKNGNNFKGLEECETVCSKHVEIFKFGRVNESSPEDESRCDKVDCPHVLYGHYESLGCSPVYDAHSCCPTRYDCPDPSPPEKGTLETTCRHNGKYYEIGEQVNASEPGDALIGNCRSNCFCVAPSTEDESQKLEPTIMCAKYECPEYVGVKPPGKQHCLPLYRKGACCAHDYYCPPHPGAEEHAPLAVCHVDGKEYYDGQRVHPKNNPCSHCLCVKSAEGNQGELTCQKNDCGYDVHFAQHLSAGCAPVFEEHPDGSTSCCPVSWECPHVQAKSQEEKKAKRTPEAPKAKPQEKKLKKRNLLGSRKTRQDAAPEGHEANGTASEGHEAAPAGHEGGHEANGTAPEGHEAAPAGHEGGHEANGTAEGHEAAPGGHEAAPGGHEGGHEGNATAELPPEVASEVAAEVMTENNGTAAEVAAELSPEVAPDVTPELNGTVLELNGTVLGVEEPILELNGTVVELNGEVNATAPVVSPKSVARCKLPKSSGPCKHSVLSYYYHQESKSCEEFSYSGCFGNGNRFATLHDCETICKGPMENEPQHGEADPHESLTIEQLTEDLELTCVFGDLIVPFGAVLPAHKFEEGLAPCGKPVCRCVTPPALTCFQKPCPESDVVKDESIALLVDEPENNNATVTESPAPAKRQA